MICKAPTFNGLNEQNRVWHNWNEDIQFTATEYFEPSHSAPNVTDGLLQLVHVVARATHEGQSLRVIGAGWAFEDIAKSDAWVVSLARLDRQLEYVVGNGGAGLTDGLRAVQSNVDSPTRLVHVEAGIRIATLCERLQAQGLAMPTLGGANGQSLAGAISTSTHGGDWQQPPFPDLVRAVHLVTDGGRELWIERDTNPITTKDRLQPLLPCASTEIVYDNRVFDAVLVACGRFGVIYSVILETRKSFRVVEVITTPTQAEVMQALRVGQATKTLFQPLFDLLDPRPKPAKISDANGIPYFLQIVFNSQNTNDVWVHRRWETTVAEDLLSAPPESLHALAVIIVASANAFLVDLAGKTFFMPLLGLPASLSLLGLTAYLDGLIASRTFRFGSVVSAVLDVLWKVPLVSNPIISSTNFKVIDHRFRTAIDTGRRGPHFLITTGPRADSDQTDYRSDSIEVVFDATQPGFLDFLDDVLAKAPSFQQAGIIALRPSKRSRAYLSMHNVTGTHAVSIELATLKFLPGNLAWMQYVHRAAVQRGGRPHWGQYNKLDESNVSMLYGSALNEWRKALLQVSGESRLFSNNFCRVRGLEPIARRMTATSLAAWANGDGRIEVCAIAPDNGVYHIWQTVPNNGWSLWGRLGTANDKVKSLVMERNKDGRLEVFAVGTDDCIYHIWQTAPNSGWSAWGQLGTANDKAKNLAVGQNKDGRLEVFAVGTDDCIYHIWQTALNSGWSAWGRLGTSSNKATALALYNNKDGRIELLTVGTDSHTYRFWQSAPNNGWSGQGVL
ncbi:MAG: FAD-binding protein [Candidatus Competibacter sp.]|nr:FAD-binding protein [Candidatus Competibacter sp.]